LDGRLEKGFLRLLRQLVQDFKSRPKAKLALAFVVVANQLTLVASAAVPSSSLDLTSTRDWRQTAVCGAGVNTASSSLGCTSPMPVADTHVSLPPGAEQCPASGPGAACSSTDGKVKAMPGVASTPDGQSPCPTIADNPGLSSPAACTDTQLPDATPLDVVKPGESLAQPAVTPSVPVSSLRPVRSVHLLDLVASDTFVQTGQKATLTATSSTSITGTNSAIQIFDQTTHTLAGACTQSSQCIVAYAATSGVHTFAAFVTPPGAGLPADGTSLKSNQVSLTWLGIALEANQTLVAPGRPVTFTATSTFDVGTAGRVIVIYDNTTKQQLTYCSRGTTCSTSLTQAAGGVREIIGWIPGRPEAVSHGITTTWLGASLTANTTSQRTGGVVHLAATANFDLTNTPWSLGIYDQHGLLVGPPCKTGSSCSTDITLATGDTPLYEAVIGAVPAVNSASTLGQLLLKVQGASSLVDIQARSAKMQPTRILWGVDSCKAFTGSPTGADGLLPAVEGRFGTPDFWGRYLTNTVCPGISAAEISAAASHRMGILPIYNQYDCSNVVGYDTGTRYAAAATSASAGLGIPQGRAIAIDIEPPGDACPGAAGVDVGFIQGWFDGVAGAGYAPTYYGNGTAGTEFASAWCAAVSAQPAVAAGSYLWSFQPSLLGGYTKANAPGYRPYEPGCPGNMVAWQYQIDSSMSPASDVDHDEALSTLPIWYPKA
jgi:hypothetical protein